MAQFTDTEGRKWTVDITVATLKRVRSVLNVDLLEALEGKLIDQLIRNPVLLVDVLFVVCKPQADERQVSDEKFGTAMAGDAIETATQALLEALVSFCPNQRDRAALGKVIETTNRAMEKARDVVAERINSGELDKAVDEAVRRATAGGSSTSAPASAG